MKAVLQKLLTEIIAEEFGADVAKSLPFVVTVPPKLELGDYATNAALILAKKLGKSPQEVGEILGERLEVRGESILEKVEVAGGFLNFTLNSGFWAREVIEEVVSRKSEFGKALETSGEKVMVEYLSPNTNKPLHLGHLRNGVTGVSVINILKSQGKDVVSAGIINDRGVHICKAMLAYKLFGVGSSPESMQMKPDHFVGDWYVRFAEEAQKDQTLETKAQDMLKAWEAGDEETIKLWQQIKDWVLEGWSETEKTLGFSYDRVYFESDVYKLGKDVVEQGLKSGVFRVNEQGNTICDLPEEQFGLNEDGSPRVLTLLRADGTSLYTTQDLGLAVKRAGELNLDQLVYVVGSEQRYHFQALFYILKSLGFEWAGKLKHLWYGMVTLPSGKMKSREGTVVDADDLIVEVSKLAQAEVEARLSSENKLSSEDIASRSMTIALAAIKFQFLKQKPTTDILFDPSEAVSFDGFTGPYCLYAYARAKSILRNSSGYEMNVEAISFDVLDSLEEKTLVRQIESFSELLARAAEEFNPSLLCVFLFEMSQAFNVFYAKHQVLKAEDENAKMARMRLVEATAQVIKNGLEILGIETVEEM